MSPERIRNESYSYPADIWSLGLALLESGTGEFPYTANEGPVNLMLQVCADSLSCYMFPFVCVDISMLNFSQYMNLKNIFKGYL